MVGHEVCDNYTDGYKDNAYERNTSVWEKEADPTDPDNGDDDTTPSKTTGKTTGKKVAPNTGDDSNLSLWAALLFISGGAAIGTAAARKKKKYTK